MSFWDTFRVLLAIVVIAPFIQITGMNDEAIFTADAIEDDGRDWRHVSEVCEVLIERIQFGFLLAQNPLDQFREPDGRVNYRPAHVARHRGETDEEMGLTAQGKAASPAEAHGVTSARVCV